MGEVILIRLPDPDEEFMRKLEMLIHESGYHMQEIAKEKASLSFEGLDIYPNRHQVLRMGKEIVLTGKEFQILLLLARHRGQVFTKEQIYDRIWNAEYVYDERNLTAYINKIRKKIEPDPTHPVYIQTIWGVGYKFIGKLK